MGQTQRLVTRLTGQKLWEAVRRMLETIGAERRKRFELGEREEPAANQLTVAHPPTLDGDGEQRPPQHDICERSEQLIAAGLRQFAKTRQLLDAARSGDAVLHERFLQ